MKDFYFKMMPKVKFGVGASDTASDLCKEFGGTKVFLMADKTLMQFGGAVRIIHSLESAGIEYVLYTDIEVDPTIEAVDKIAKVLKESGCDLCISVGGGSTIDTAKAVCILHANEGTVKDYLYGGSKTVSVRGLPLICVPTTAGTGAEVTAASVITYPEKNIKLSVTHEYLIPKGVILDPLIQASLPSAVTAYTGVDALTHAIESYVSLNANPMGDAFCIQTIRMIGENLRNVVADGSNIEARGNMAMASLMGGVSILNCGLGVVHGIAQSMGGIAGVPHGLANALILPYAMRINFVGNLEKFKNIAVLLGENVTGMSLRDAAAQAAEAVGKLEDDIGLPRNLSQVGITREMFPQIVKDTMAYRLLAINPVKIKEKDVLNILEMAF